MVAAIMARSSSQRSTRTNHQYDPQCRPKLLEACLLGSQLNPHKVTWGYGERFPIFYARCIFSSM
eukprot:552167-Amphidinium_carterae.1